MTLDKKNVAITEDKLPVWHEKSVIEEVDDNLEPLDDAYDADYDVDAHNHNQNHNEKCTEGDDSMSCGCNKGVNLGRLKSKCVVPDSAKEDLSDLEIKGVGESFGGVQGYIDNFNLSDDYDKFLDCEDKMDSRDIVVLSTGLAVVTTLVVSSALAGYFIGKKGKKTKQ